MIRYFVGKVNATGDIYLAALGLINERLCKINVYQWKCWGEKSGLSMEILTPLIPYQRDPVQNKIINDKYRDYQWKFYPLGE